MCLIGTVGYNRYMEATNLLKYIGKSIVLTDQRTGAKYSAKIKDAKEAYGRLRLSVADGAFFEPTPKELQTVQ